MSNLAWMKFLAWVIDSAWVEFFGASVAHFA